MFSIENTMIFTTEIYWDKYLYRNPFKNNNIEIYKKFIIKIFLAKLYWKIFCKNFVHQ